MIAAERGTTPLLPLAHVYPHSNHHYELRWWLASAGIDPDQDLNLVVVPPPMMLEQLRSGRIDGFYCGSPGRSWRARGCRPGAVRQAGSVERRPDKIFGVTAELAGPHAADRSGSLRALIAAAVWLDEPRYHAQAADWMIAGGTLNVERELLIRALASSRFHAGAAGFPWRSHALWLLAQMRRWKHFETRACRPRKSLRAPTGPISTARLP